MNPKQTKLHSELIPAPDPHSRRLMVMMHGLGDSIEGYRWLPEALRLPWMNYLLVNAPDEYYGGYSWFDFGGDILPGVKRSRARARRLVSVERSAGRQGARPLRTSSGRPARRR